MRNRCRSSASLSTESILVQKHYSNDIVSDNKRKWEIKKWKNKK